MAYENNKAINYTDVVSVSNRMDPMAFATAPLGTDKGAGFGWEDISIIKLGVEYAGVDTWTFRGGYLHTDQLVPNSEVMFNILASEIIEDHITLGCSKTLGDSGKALYLALIYAMPASVKGSNLMDSSQSIEIEMN